MLLSHGVAGPISLRIGHFFQNLRRLGQCLLLVFPVLDVTAFAKSEEISPSHVFQVSENILYELIVIQKERGVRYQRNSIDVKTRQPRHSWLKTREILIKIHRIKELNGLEISEIPQLSVQEVSCKDVANLAGQVLQEVRELKTALGIKAPAKMARLKTSKTATDVYEIMTQISLMLDRILGISVKPADVYRIIVTIKTSLLKIHNSQEHYKKIRQYQAESRKSPRDVYLMAHLLLGKVKQLSLRPEYTPKGGVITLDLKGGRTMPSDVIDVMQNILAEVNAIENKIGISTKTQLAPFVPGKIPSDVYNKTMEAIAVTEAIL